GAANAARAVAPAMPDRTRRRRRWRLKRADGAAVETLARELNLQPATAAVLANRGHGDPDAARRFLAPAFADLPDPRLMKDMDRAVEVMVRAIRERRRIVCHGDYDVDGVSGSAILIEFL